MAIYVSSTIIKPPSLLHSNLVPRHISAQVGSNQLHPMGSLPVQYNPAPRFPDPPIHQNLPLYQDTNYRPSYTCFASQQPANKMSYIPHQSQSTTAGAPTFHSNPVNIPPNLRFPFPNGHGGKQQVPAFTL
jgi:hypothetical protein